MMNTGPTLHSMEISDKRVKEMQELLVSQLGHHVDLNEARDDLEALTLAVKIMLDHNSPSSPSESQEVQLMKEGG